MFRHADRVIERATEIALAAVKGNREHADRLKAEIVDVESDQTRLVELLMDRSISDASRSAINRKLAAGEARRAELAAALDRLREDANESTEEVARTSEKRSRRRDATWRGRRPPRGLTALWTGL